MWIHLVIVEVKLHYSWYLLEVRQEQSTLTHLFTGFWGYMCSSIDGNETQSHISCPSSAHWSWALTSNMKLPDKLHRSPLAWAQGPKRNFKSWIPLPTFPLGGKKKRVQCSQVQQGGEKRWILGSLAFCQQEAALPSCHIGDENRKESHPWG